MITYTRQLFDHIRHSIGANDISLEFTDSDKIGYNHSIKTIFIGRRYIDNIVEHGFKDYRSLQPIWNKYGYDFILYGEQAIYATLIHEFAHYLQSDKNHSADFREKLEILIQYVERI